MGRLERRSVSLVPWFLLLFSLNVLDISLTNPSLEANPFTLFSWANMGILPSACMKLGLVVVFGVLCASAKRVANPADWILAGRVLRATLIVLVAFYSFVVTWNLVLML